MNTIREIQNLNKREIEAGVSTEASWHADYRDTAYVYIGGLPFDLSEGDILTIFSQYGEPTYINLIRDKESGKSKGFAFLKYEDQRSTDLAVDNLGGATIMGRVLKVDHTRYKRKEGEEEEEEARNLRGSTNAETGKSDTEKSDEERRPLLKEEIELQKLLRDHDDDDPMKEYLVREKKEEVSQALAKVKNGNGVERRDKKKSSHRHHHHHHRRHDDHRDRERTKIKRESDRSDEEERNRNARSHHRHRPR